MALCCVWHSLSDFGKLDMPLTGTKQRRGIRLPSKQKPSTVVYCVTPCSKEGFVVLAGGEILNL